MKKISANFSNHLLSSAGFLLLLIFIMLSTLTCSGNGTSAKTGILPHPRIENYGSGKIVLSENNHPISVTAKNVENAAPLKLGIELLSKRIEFLGGQGAELRDNSDKSHIVLEKCSAQQFEQILKANGVEESVDGKRLEQAYFLHIASPTKDNASAVSITAASELGLYYGLVSVCQLVESDNNDKIIARETKIVDWPEIGLRLAKASATLNSLDRLQLFTKWLPVYKMSVVGLQYHGGNSLEPEEPFPTNIKVLCRQNRDSGILKSIVYFCPFRGGGKIVTGVDSDSYKKPGAYDFTKNSDRKKYAQYLQWIADQGAHGIEVDYNDWPGLRTPIEDVLNLACEAIEEKSPDMYVLYCAPHEGTSTYFGRASSEMRRILSNVPEKVWPIWTGLHYLLTYSPVTTRLTEEWIRDGGRRPYLWINRAQINVAESLSNPFVIDGDSTWVFRGETITKELNRFFEGTHFNCDTHLLNDKNELIYFATAADYVWNPHNWIAEESGRRARRFIDIMLPLLGTYK